MISLQCFLEEVHKDTLAVEGEGAAYSKKWVDNIQAFNVLTFELQIVCE